MTGKGQDAVKLATPGRWQAFPSWRRALIKKLLAIALVVGIVVFISPSSGGWVARDGKESTFTIGAFDPWWTSKRQENFFEGGFKSFNSTHQVRSLTWSMGCGVLALVAFYGLMAIRRLEKSQLPPPEPAKLIAAFRWAGAWLLASGILSLISGAPYFMAMAIPSVPEHILAGLAALTFFEFWVGLIRGILIIRGANAAREFRDLGRVQLASVVALIPISLGWLWTFPVGIWVRHLLSRPEVIEAFEKKQTHEKE